MGSGCLFHGVGQAGSWEPGIWDYKALPQPGSQEMADNDVGVSWSYDSNTQLMILYDTEVIVKKKTQFILDSGLCGAMFWEIEGSLITTFVEGVRYHGKSLETSYNALKYSESQYDNLRADFSDE
ncbi:endochitinase [Histoplasma capsulatum H143]|uniref:Endochitinase n=1 Tax=Ajellomyces capsulatus (strain H143) TaxID=544712 RepID=C6H8W3_AJECH|nr:endochitinase [Histoplasma capsulatum H143]